MVLKIIVASIIAAVVLFAWGTVSWMVLPWHGNTLMHFNSDQEVIDVIKKNAAQSGIYVIPTFKEKTATTGMASSNKPMIFAAIHLDGLPNMDHAMIVGFMTQLIAAFLVSFMVACAKIQRYFCRLGLVVVFALAAAVVCEIPVWNWWRFPINFTLVNIADLLISWFLAGLIIAAIVKKGNEKTS